MSVSCEMLLHPELLTNQQLINVILERHLRITDVECMSRDELLEVFHHFCVPYGQRKYRDSGRGKLLNKIRNLSPDRKPIFETTFNTTQKKKWLNIDERLKPPPDLLSGHLKRIKLEISQNNKDFNNKRKISVEPMTIADSPPPKKERKLITWP